MFLEDKFADVRLRHEDEQSFEVWWFYGSSMLAVSHKTSRWIPPSLLGGGKRVRRQAKRRCLPG